MNLDHLNARFAIDGRLAFAEGPGGWPHARLSRGDAQAEVSLYGGHVLRYTRGGAPVLWLSRQALFAEGKAIRGGIPICWPWFGPHPSDPARPAHGFARISHWEASDSGAGDHATWLRLRLSDSPATHALWPHPFRLDLLVTLSDALDVALTAHNPGDTPWRCTGALHSYFTVGDVAQIRIGGLDGARYLDQLTGQSLTQAGPVRFDREVDRIYADAGPACTIDDPALGRRIVVAKAGSRSTVIWNPWAEKARRLADFADDEYPEMVCVETANAGADVVEVAPGGSHTLRATIA